MNVIYSIGHSNHELEAFMALLQRHGVTTLVDVRSQPYSRRVSHMNREPLAQALQAAGLTYVFMGDGLGGRPARPSLYGPEGEPDYERMAAAPDFQTGLARLLELARASVVAIMCSEGDHTQCHRHKLITPELLKHKARVLHIRPGGETVEARPEPKQLSLF
ncbi:MAG: DUF488 domain-containing protein [Anaerolineae bacterium]|jgi:uncharacterized protein (DUF488 family)